MIKLEAESVGETFETQGIPLKAVLLTAEAPRVITCEIVTFSLPVPIAPPLGFTASVVFTLKV